MQYLSNVFSKKHRDKELSSLKNLDSIHPDMAVFSIVKIRNILILSNLYKEYKSETGFCLRKDSNFKMWLTNSVLPLMTFSSIFACIVFRVSTQPNVIPFLFYSILICCLTATLGFIFATCLLFYSCVTKLIIDQYGACENNKEIILNSIKKMQNIKYKEEKDKIMKVVSLKKESEPVRRKRL